MWRIQADNFEQQIKEDSLRDILPTFGYEMGIDRYMITMNRNFEDDPDLS